MNKCTDCNGSGRYVSCFTDEPCQRCGGSGRERSKNPKADVLKSMFDAQPKRYLDAFDHAEECDKVVSLTRAPDVNGQGTILPEIVIGTTIHVFDCDWYQAEVTHIYQASRGGHDVTMIRADAPCDTFRMMLTAMSFNVTKNRWEFIKAGTPVC